MQGIYCILNSIYADTQLILQRFLSWHPALSNILNLPRPHLSLKLSAMDLDISSEEDETQIEDC